MCLDDCCLPFAQRKIIGSSVLVTFTSICATVRCDILLVYSSLYQEDTCMEAAHAWVFVVKSVGLRGGSFYSAKLYLMMLPADILKAYHDSTKTEFVW